MASQRTVSPNMGLFEPQPTKPHPLRIIKRSQTITGNSTTCQIFGGDIRRGSGGSVQSLNESFNVGSPPFGADRPLTVHKLRKKRPSVLEGFVDSSPENSLDAISDLVSRSSEQTLVTLDDPDLTPKAKKAVKAVPRTFSAGNFLRSEFYRGSSETPDSHFSGPKIPERRRSKSKNFLMKAIGGRGSTRQLQAPQHGKAPDSPTRRVSGKSMTSTFMYEDSLAESITRSALVLCPQITITPEVQSMESGSCSLWVGISVTGKLDRSDGEEGFEGTLPSLDSSHGKLHSMRIELFPGKDCLIREIVGNLHELKTVCPGETLLILAKIRLGKINLPFSIGSDNLIADLENQLGNSITHYLKVRITYSHSGFKDTIMQTEATGSVKRHNAHSAWVVTQPENPRIPSNPVIVLIESHFPVDKARQALRKLAADRIQIPLAKRQSATGRSALGSSEETVKIENIPPLRLDAAVREDGFCSKPIPVPQKYETFSSLPDQMLDYDMEMDPARKIWTEMRRNSRGHHHRTSVSAGNYEPLDTTLDPIENVSQWITDNDVGYERERIRDVALKNKRSVGQDTLRSMAPSTKKGNVGALGLGRNWGWPGWW